MSNLPIDTGTPEMLSTPLGQVKPLLLLTSPNLAGENNLRLCIQGLADTWRLLEALG